MQHYAKQVCMDGATVSYFFEFNGNEVSLQALRIHAHAHAHARVPARVPARTHVLPLSHSLTDALPHTHATAKATSVLAYAQPCLSPRT